MELDFLNDQMHCSEHEQAGVMVMSSLIVSVKVMAYTLVYWVTPPILIESNLQLAGAAVSNLTAVPLWTVMTLPTAATLGVMVP